MNASLDVSPLLALLQLNDSAFPSGAFTHSYGLEQLVREGVVRDVADVERVVGSLLSHTVAPSEASAAWQSACAAEREDLTGVLALDRGLHALKPAQELRNASLQTGRRFLEEVCVHGESSLLAAYRGAVATDAHLGSYAVAFGVVAAAHQIEARYVPAAVLLAAATAMLQASMRLARVSHRDVQGILHRQRSHIAKLATEVRTKRVSLESLTGFNPVQDIASMRHARAEARLFAS